MEQALHILYGTRSGNSQWIAAQAALYCHNAGLRVVLHNIHSLDPAELEHMPYFWLIVSTHGEGDPPAAVEGFYRSVHASSMPRLENNHYAVLGLGDSNYRNYCQTGVDFDRRFEELGGHRLTELIRCDLDFEHAAMVWIEENTSSIMEMLPDTFRLLKDEKAHKSLSGLAKGKRKRGLGRLVEKRLLSGDESTKEVYHLALQTGKRNWDHQPGDCVKIKGANPRWLTDSVIERMNMNPAQSVELDGRKVLLKEALLHEFELTSLGTGVVRRYTAYAAHEALNNLLDCEPALHEYVKDRDVLDLVSDFPVSLTPDEFIGLLRRNRSRSYSIASGDQSVPGEIHLTVNWVNFSRRQRDYAGIASSHLSSGLELGESLDFELERNQDFYFPDNAEVPILMLASSTGIAPFRSFLQERRHRGVKGNTWLLFGDRHRATDYLYQDELMAFLDDGTLERLDADFSRDHGDQKVYLQDQIRRNGAELAAWIDRGACIYLCGTRNNMAREIRQEIISMLEWHRNLSPAQARAFFMEMKEEGRYREDVY